MIDVVMSEPPASNAWQQEKEFLDYMFITLHRDSAQTDASDEPASTPPTPLNPIIHSINTMTTTQDCGAGPAASPAISLTPTIPMSPTIPASRRAGLDHLDNLCKLMEQLGELRDQNSRLQKRVHYLEDMKTLQEMHHELDLYVDTPALRKNSTDSVDVDDAAPAAAVVAAVTAAVKPIKTDASRKTEAAGKNKGHHHMRFKKPLLLKYRERSKSVGFDESSPVNEIATPPASPPSPVVQHAWSIAEKRFQVTPQQATPATHQRTKTKVSKWTRVKEAFRWEKAHVEPAASSNAKLMISAPLIKATTPLASKMLPAAITLASTLHPPSPPPLPLVDLAAEEGEDKSPVFHLRRTSTTASTSSSSLSECPLESEILKSFADAQELPLFRLEKRASTSDMIQTTSTVPIADTSLPLLGVLQHPSSMSSQLHLKRLHRKSTVSCDANFATLFASADKSPVADFAKNLTPSPDQIEPFSASEAEVGEAVCDSPRRKTMPATSVSVVVGDHDGFMANLRSQLRPINEWTSKLHADLKNSLSVQSATSGGSDMGGVDHHDKSVSVPSSPHHHHAFTFDEFADMENEQSRDYLAPRQKKTCDLPEQVSSSSSSSSTTNTTSTTTTTTLIASLAHPGQLFTSISPEFLKKVEVWERLKSGLAVATPPPPPPPFPTESGASGSTAVNAHSKRINDSPEWKDREADQKKLPPAFKKKLAEWEIRKAVAGKSDQNVEDLQKILPLDFNRKLQEWERIKAAAVNKPASPGTERQHHQQHQYHQHKQQQAAKCKSEAMQQREKHQKEKELQWLEKELQKIEREKHRLEREREKYIERETRLEKIREAMRQPHNHREICIRTSTGEFRFQGLSRKFTKKLWQWEEQKGIRPEASTIALLDGAYRPPPLAGVPGASGGPGRASSLSVMSRCKSESSVADLVNASGHSQTSSLSLNDADASVDFDRHLVAVAMEGLEQDEGAPTAPGALLVEVEDVMEESAPIVDIPDVLAEAPIYSIASPELRQTIESQAKIGKEKVQVEDAVGCSIRRNDSVRTEASLKLLDENLTLLDRLRAKGEIVKYLELQMSSIDGDMAGVASTQTEEMDRLREEETSLTNQPGVLVTTNVGSNSMCTVDRLKRRITHLENRGQQLKSEKEQLKAVYEKQCTQQMHLIQHLVNKMQQLRGIGACSAPDPYDPETIQRLESLTTELLEEARFVGESIQQPESEGGMLMFPEQLSIKANRLRDEFERLRSVDSDDDDDEDADGEDEDEDAAAAAAAAPPPPPPPALPLMAEMSSADRKKIFVETRRLIFAPVNYSDRPDRTELRKIQVQEDENREDQEDDHSVAPWHQNSTLNPVTNRYGDPVGEPENRESSTTPDEEEDNRADVQIRTTAVRTTAPNIRRMIDKYHQKMTGTGAAKEKPVLSLNLNIRTRLPATSDRSLPPSPLLIIEDKCPTPPAPDDIQQSDNSPQPSLLQPNRIWPEVASSPLCKSQSTGAIKKQAPPPPSPQSPAAGNNTGRNTLGYLGLPGPVLRSRSGLCPFPGRQNPESSPTQHCTRNPSFFRKSPLDPSIDELLNKYRGGGTAGGGERASGSHPPKIPINPERAVKLKQAREAFLSIGPTVLSEAFVREELDDASRYSETDSLQSSNSTLTGATITSVSDRLSMQEKAMGEENNCLRSCPSTPVFKRSSSKRRSQATSVSVSASANPLQPPVPPSRYSWLKPSNLFFGKPKSP